MSIEKNVQIVKEFLCSDRQRAISNALLALVAEDIEWIIPGEDWPLAGTHRGHAGLERLTSESQRDGGDFIPRTSRVHSAGRPGPGRRRRYWENQSHE